MYVFAKLSDDQLKALQDFEQNSEVKLLAVTDVTLEPAALDAEKVAHLRDLEEQLGMCLVAVE